MEASLRDKPDRHIVAQNGANAVQVAFFVGDGDQPPLAISGGKFDPEDRRRRAAGLPGRLGRIGHHAGQRCCCHQAENDPSHRGASSNARPTVHLGWIDAGPE